MSSSSEIPIYGIDKFKDLHHNNKYYKVEVFDHNRHYKVEYPHRHDFFFEVLYIKNGSGAYNIDFQHFDIQPETLFFVSPGQVHEISFSNDIFGYIFLFTEEFLSISESDFYPLFDEIGSKKEALIIKSADLVQKFEFAFIEAIRNFDLNDKLSDNICRDYLNIILRMSMRESINENHTFYQKTKGSSIVRQFKQLINQKYAEYLSVKDYAHILSITPNHLNETIKEYTGLTANALIDNKLLIEIKRQLAYTDKDISEVAFDFNFKDQSYFSKFFKIKTGFTPKEFKLNSIKNT